MNEEDAAFIAEVDAVFQKHGKMLFPHMELVLQVRPMMKIPTAPNGGVQTPGGQMGPSTGAAIAGSSDPTTTSAPAADASQNTAPAAEPIPSPIQRSDLSSPDAGDAVA